MSYNSTAQRIILKAFIVKAQQMLKINNQPDAAKRLYGAWDWFANGSSNDSLYFKNVGVPASQIDNIFNSYSENLEGIISYLDSLHFSSEYKNMNDIVKEFSKILEDDDVLSDYIEHLEKGKKTETDQIFKGKNVRNCLTDKEKEAIITEVKNNLKNSFGSFKKREKDPKRQFAGLLVFSVTGEFPLEKDTLPSNNIYMATKGEIEAMHPLSGSEYTDVKHISIVNFAGSSFLSKMTISSDYKHNFWDSFADRLRTETNLVDIILTDPYSSAAKDAELYKMKPRELKVPKDEIIERNIYELKTVIIPYFNSKAFSLRQTDIALPCAYFMTEYNDDSRDNIKIDIYLPSFGEYEKDESNGKQQLKTEHLSQSDGEHRPSFVVYKKDNAELYKLFKENIEDIIKNSKPIDFRRIFDKLNVGMLM